MNLGYKIIKSKKKRIRPAAGIRRKIRYGFIILGLLLLFSGTISYLELSRLSRTTRELMDGSIRDLVLSKNMLDAVNQQNASLYMRTHNAQIDSLNTDSLFQAGRVAFDAAYRNAEELQLHTNRLSRVQVAKTAYDRVLQQPDGDYSSQDSISWYNHSYKIAYYDLALAVRDFMIDSQKTIDDNTNLVQNNAYRAIMPGIITLIIAIIILFVFYILIDSYYIRPVLKVKQGLTNYINGKIPYTIQVEGRDEIKELNDQIRTLVTMTRKKENNE